MPTNQRVLVYIQAYNAEPFIDRAIKSILAQTYKNFSLWICDNGSTDNTREIIKAYALHDKRITVYSNEYNDRLTFFKKYLPMKLRDQSCNWYANLDADDEYAPDFLERMIKFVSENNLEAATCGTDWIDAKTGEIIKYKAIDKSLILEGQNFAEQFPRYRNFMVTVWGAVFSLDLLRKCDFDWAHNAMNYEDTAFCMEAFRRAKRAGVLAESLHKYYISPKTGSYKYSPNWFYACKYLHKISREYLLDYGEISKQNEDYLCVLFLILIKYVLPRIQNSDIDLSEKLKSLCDIFTDDITQDVLRHWEKVGIYSSKSDFLREIEEWIYEQDGWEQLLPAVQDIISAIKLDWKCQCEPLY